MSTKWMRRWGVIAIVVGVPRTIGLLLDGQSAVTTSLYLGTLLLVLSWVMKEDTA